MQQILTKLLPLAVALSLALAQAPLTQALPPDPDLIVGKLPNGLSYYIKKNGQPKDRAELRLVVNAGSNQEGDDQKGLAHFVEHMVFKGTKRFPDLEVVNFLEKIGMQFGPDINAFTSFDETGYILKIPTTDPATVQKSFDVLEDWAQWATIAAKDVQTESGVIVEEERTRDQTASGRVSKQLINLLAGGSRYAERRPIGDMNIVRSNPSEAIRRFYQDWYRPDLMAVVAVGDFDPRVIEGIITRNFSNLQNPANPRPRGNYAIPNRSEDRFLVAADPEFPSTQVRIYRLRPGSSQKTLGDVKSQIQSELFEAMLGYRLDDLANGANPPFVSAGGGMAEFVRGQNLDVLTAQVREGQEKVALDALITELRRAQMGFGAGELERAKRDLLAGYEKAYNERDKTASERIADAYLDAFLTEGVPTGPQTDYDLAKRFIGEATLEEVNALAQGFMKGPRDYMVVRPQKQGLAALDEAELKQTVAEAGAKAVQPYQDVAVVSALLDKIPGPAAISKDNPQKEYTELVLANGARVLYKKTDFKADEVLFRAYSPGGASLYSDQDYPVARIIGAVVDQSGLGGLDRAQLQRVMSGKQAQVTPYIDEREEGMRGQTTVRDLQTLFQLVYLYFTQPRADAEIFDKEKQTRLEALKNRALNPISALQDVLDDYRLQGTIRGRPFSQQAIEQLNRERGLAIYKERFGNAANFTFIFVGNFDEAQLRDLAQRYLGSLPGKSKDTWKNIFPKQNYAKTEKNVYRGKDQRGYAVVYYAAPVEFDVKTGVVASALRNLLDIRITEELREKLGGIYSAGVSIGINREPYSEAAALIQFSSDPQKTEDLLKALFTVIDEVRSQGANDTNLTKVREQLKRSREEQLRDNNFWLSRLASLAQFGDIDPNDTSSFFSTVDNLTSDDLKLLAQQIFKDTYLKGVLYPEAMQPK